MKNKKCPAYIKSHATGLKCKHFYNGNRMMVGNINHPRYTEFGWTGAKEFVNQYCKGEFEECRLYKENI